MKIALLQLEVLEKNKAANVAHGLQLAADAAKEHDLLVLPEVWTTGYSLGHLEQDAEPQDSPVLAQLAELARSEQCAILAGSVPMRHADGKVYNTSAAINKNGEIVNLYDKVHLFGLFHEEDFFAPGNNFNAFTLDGLCCGSTICYDLRFPELFRHPVKFAAHRCCEQDCINNGIFGFSVKSECYYKHSHRNAVHYS